MPTHRRLADGPYIGLAALTHHSDAGIATGSASLFDVFGTIARRLRHSRAGRTRS